MSGVNSERPNEFRGPSLQNESKNTVTSVRPLGANPPATYELVIATRTASVKNYALWDLNPAVSPASQAFTSFTRGNLTRPPPVRRLLDVVLVSAFASSSTRERESFEIFEI